MSDLAQAIEEHMLEGAVIREQEGIKSLLAHSQETLDTGLSRNNMTIFTISVQDERLNGGRETIIPSFWNGKVETDRETNIKNALQSGRKWPSGFNIKEAQDLDDYAHIAIRKQTVGENNATR